MYIKFFYQLSIGYNTEQRTCFNKLRWGSLFSCNAILYMSISQKNVILHAIVCKKNPQRLIFSAPEPENCISYQVFCLDKIFGG